MSTQQYLDTGRDHQHGHAGPELTLSKSPSTAGAYASQEFSTQTPYSAVGDAIRSFALYVEGDDTDADRPCRTGLVLQPSSFVRLLTLDSSVQLPFSSYAQQDAKANAPLSSITTRHLTAAESSNLEPGTMAIAGRWRDEPGIVTNVGSGTVSRQFLLHAALHAH